MTTRALVVVVVLTAVATGVVLSGVISVKASSGHLPITAWMLDLVKVRSVVTRSIGIEVPALGEPGLVRLGANHFDRTCRPCHGTPWQGPPVVPARMTPHPPALADGVGRWRDRELFYLVAHGVKFTGMPAWASPVRTDEAWAVVAFLRALPTLDAGAYEALVPRASDQTSMAMSCLHACHRDDVTLAPRLVGQSAAYLSAALDAYADGRRHSGVMQPVAAALGPAARAAVAAALADSGASEPVPAPAPVIDGLLARGDPGRDVPPCVDCHGPTSRPRDPRYPSLAGQPAAYLRLQLRLFAEGRRGGTSYGDIMRPIAARLTPEHIEEAAAAFAALAQPGRRKP